MLRIIRGGGGRVESVIVIVFYIADINLTPFTPKTRSDTLRNFDPSLTLVVIYYLHLIGCLKKSVHTVREGSKFIGIPGRVFGDF